MKKQNFDFGEVENFIKELISSSNRAVEKGKHIEGRIDLDIPLTIKNNKVRILKEKEENQNKIKVKFNVIIEKDPGGLKITISK
jgi:hypothetical protein